MYKKLNDSRMNQIKNSMNNIRAVLKNSQLRTVLVRLMVSLDDLPRSDFDPK